MYPMIQHAETSEESKDAETGDPTNPMLVYINKDEIESGGISVVIAPGNMKVKCFKQLLKQLITDGSAVCIDNETDKDLEIRNITKNKQYNRETIGKQNAEAVKLFQDAMSVTDKSNGKGLISPALKDD